MRRKNLFCICTIAAALIGCTQNVYLEEQTPPGKVPPATSTSTVPDDGSAQPDESVSM